LINWAALELGIDLTMGDLGENPHPFGKIPCLTDLGGEVGIFESGAILQYLHDQYGDRLKTRLSLGQSAALASWIVWANASLEPICFVSSDDGKIQDTGLRRRSQKDLKDIYRLDEILGNVARQQQRLSTQAGMPDDGRDSDRMGSRVAPRGGRSRQSAFLLGNEFTLADVAVASYLLFALRFYPDTDLSRWPNIVKYMYSCASREAYGRAFGRDVQELLLGLLRDMVDDDVTSSTIVLYGHPSSTAPIIDWAGYELKLDNIRKGNLADNPAPYGKVPCLTDQNGKIMVFDNGPILQYLQDYYGKDRIQQKDPMRRDSPRNDGRKFPSSLEEDSAQISSWIDWASSTLEPICLTDEPRSGRRPGSQDRQLESMKPRPESRGQMLGQDRPPSRRELPDARRGTDFYALEGRDLVALDELNHRLGQKQRQLEQRLQQPEQASGGRVVRSAPPSSCFLVGDEFSLADVAVASLLLYIPQNFPSTDLSRWPYLVRYMKDCARRPGYSFAFGREVQQFVLDELDLPRDGPQVGSDRIGRGRPPTGSDRMGGDGARPLGRGIPDRIGGPGLDDDDRRRNDGDRGLFTPAYRK
jgi:glutathione S-transferase/alpha,alpha-trehalase